MTKVVHFMLCLFDHNFFKKRRKKGKLYFKIQHLTLPELAWPWGSTGSWTRGWSMPTLSPLCTPPPVLPLWSSGVTALRACVGQEMAWGVAQAQPGSLERKWGEGWGRCFPPCQGVSLAFSWWRAKNSTSSWVEPTFKFHYSTVSFFNFWLALSRHN